MKDELAMDAVARPIIWLLAVSSFILHPSSFAMADGGMLRLRTQSGGYEIAVFTQPTPLRAGPVDISVLVQDAMTGEIVPEARVTLRLTHRESHHVLEYPATAEAAKNKLFQAAVFELPEPGSWDVEVAVEGPHGLAVVSSGLEADVPLPRWLDLWPWFAWPVLVIMLFVIHQTVIRRRSRLSATMSGTIWRGTYPP
jgi:hypothetical protein